MALEKINLEKFNEKALNQKQMALLRAGGTATAGGRIEAMHHGHLTQFDYGYDAIRTNNDGSTYLTFHDRSNFCRVPCIIE